MALTFLGAYSLQPGTTSVTMVPPGSTLAGDYDVIWAASKLSGVEPSVPSASGFDLLISAVVGTGADGVDTGPVRLTAWGRELKAASTNTTITLTGGSVINGGGGVWRKTGSDPPWYVVASTGSDTDGSSTTFAATADLNVGLGIGDWLYTVGVLTANTTLPGRGVTTTGWTGTNTGIDSGGTANGNHLFVWSDRTGPGTAGASSVPTVVNGTTGVNTTGGALHIRIAAVARTQLSKTFAPQGHPGRRRFTITPRGTEQAAVATPIAAADTGTDTEDATVSATLTAADTGTGADTGMVAATVTGADTGGGSETATVGPQAADTAAGSESAQLGVGAADGGSGSESGSVGPRATDTGTGTDSGSIVAQITASDSGTGTDSATVDQGATPVSGSDTGAGTESGSVSAATSSSDTAASTQTGSISTTTTGTDSGSSSQSGSVAASLPGADTSTGTQTATIAASLPAADLAAATDTAAVTVVGAAQPTPAERVTTVAGEDRRTVIETARWVVPGEDRRIVPDESRVCTVKGETRKVTA